MYSQGKDHSAGASSLAEVVGLDFLPSQWLPRTRQAIQSVVNMELIHLLGELGTD